MASSSFSRRKFLVRHPVVVDVGCSCRRTKLSSLFSSSSSGPPKPRPNPRTPPKHHHPLSSYYPFSPSATTTTTTTTNFSSGATISHWETSHHASSFSLSPDEVDSSSSPSWKPAKSQYSSAPKKKVHKNSKAVKESVAVVKESDDPYHDFRDSMLQMILEKEIYAWEDLKDLLHRFLSLNSPYHHDSILRAFAEIWNGAFSSSSAAAAAGGGNCTATAFNKPANPPRRRRNHHHQQQQHQHRHHHRLSRDPMGYST